MYREGRVLLQASIETPGRSTIEVSRCQRILINMGRVSVQEII